MKKLVILIIIIISTFNSIPRLHSERASQGDALRPMATRIFPEYNQIIEHIKRDHRYWKRTGESALGEVSQFKVSVREHPGNPILIPDYKNEVFVLNPGAIRIGDTYYLAVRSSTRDKLSRIFIATSKDGYNFQRKPGFFYAIPGIDSNGGIEDSRLLIVKEFPNRVFMHFTYCHDGIFEIAESSIAMQDFININPAGWSPMKRLFPGKRDKDFVLIPRMLNNRYYAYHRPEFESGQLVGRGIHLAYTDNLIDGTWEDLGMVMAPRKDYWIGAGVVLEAENAWILIYHEAQQLADTDKRYVCKIALIDKENPANILYAPEEPILESNPSETEMLKKTIGLESWVPNVKFINGAIVLGKERL